MPLDVAATDIESDFEVLEEIGAIIDGLIEKMLRGDALSKTLRRWLAGHGAAPEDPQEMKCLMAMAADLELFTPSPSGRTMIDRHLAVASPRTRTERLALQSLGSAQFRLVRLLDRTTPDLFQLQDLATSETLPLLDQVISPMAAGMTAAMRLCPLSSGRHVLISGRFAVDEALLEGAMSFVRPGRPMGHGFRCASNLYRDAARRGFQILPKVTRPFAVTALRDEGETSKDRLSLIEILASSWPQMGEAGPDLLLEARRLASVNHLVETCGFFGQSQCCGPHRLASAYEQIASLQVETLVQRARAGVSGAERALDDVAATLAAETARGRMHPSGQDLFERLRLKWTQSRGETSKKDAPSATSDIDRVIERIRALRSKTMDRGCTEAEAMAAAAKVSELLARYDLTLDEISLRKSECEGARIATGRKRRAAVDTCMSPIAAFADCRVWSEEGQDGALHYVFFGLKADVEAARFLHDLVHATFETESAAFRLKAVYRSLEGADRRVALNSFQHGLAAGISNKLSTLKSARTKTGAQTTGFDLVAVKQAVVDEEMDRLGLNFTTRRASARRHIHGEAFQLGRAAGSLFEPNAALGR